MPAEPTTVQSESSGRLSGGRPVGELNLPALDHGEGRRRLVLTKKKTRNKPFTYSHEPRIALLPPCAVRSSWDSQVLEEREDAEVSRWMGVATERERFIAPQP